MALSYREVAQAAASAGFSGKDLQIAVAVAFAESSGNPNVVNFLGCVGLWQIYEDVHRPSHPTWTTEWLKVPANNAKAAFVIYKNAGRTWSPWSAYTNGAYQKYMDKAAKATANRISGGGGSGLSGAAATGDNAEIGPPKGAAFDLAPTVFRNSPSLDDLFLMGNKLKDNVKDSVIRATASFTTEQVSQISIDILDPELDFLAGGLARLGTKARLQKQNMVVATTETGEEKGNPVVSLKLRPEIIRKLKNRRGAKVMSNVSPSQFVKAECDAVDAGVYIQASPVRSSVARDIPEPGQIYERGSEPSSWTTFQRLAQELGYICFEENGNIFFGQPTYFASRGKKSALEVGYRTGPKSKQCLGMPLMTKSLDSKETIIEVSLPLSRAFEARCGRTLDLDGVTDEFNGFYIVKGVHYDLAGSTNMLRLEAGTPIDPIAQPPEDSNIAGSIGSAASQSDGVWPLPSKFKVTTPYGTRGSWAAGYHTGADFACPNGTPVYAVYDGKIVGAHKGGGWGDAYGNHVILDVGGNRYAYCHLSRMTVSSGTQVSAGQVIGYTGTTGRSFGPHLHLEYRKNPYRYGQDDKDPIPTLMKKGVSSGIGGADLSGHNGTKSVSDFIYQAMTRAGGRYIFGAARTPSDKNQNQFDCSSLVQWALYQVGIKNFPSSTFTQIPYLKKKGTRITIEQAKNTRGALLYRQTGSDHVAISLGDGRTFEAISPYMGIRTYTADDRGWTDAFLIPGLRY